MVLPFPGESPHGFAVNVMTQGGGNGSSIFLPETGGVMGIIDSGLDDYDQTTREDPSSDNEHEHMHSYFVPTKH